MHQRLVLIAGVMMSVFLSSIVSAQMMTKPEGGMEYGGKGMHETMGHPGGMGGYEGMGGHEMGMDGGLAGMMKMFVAVKHLDLTPDQRKQIQTLRLQHQKEAIPLMGKVRMAGVETEELLMADPVDLEKVKAKTKEKYDAMAELEISHLDLAQKIKAILTPEQRQKLDEMEMKMGHGMEGMESHPKVKSRKRGMDKPGPMMDHPPGK